MRPTQFIGARIYRGSRYGRTHPLSIERVPAVTDLARACGLLPADAYATSPRAKPEALFRFHTRRYVSELMAAEASGTVTEDVRDRHGLGTVSNPVFPEMYRRPATAVGGGLLAADLVAQGGAVYNPGGGTHHGMPDRAAGFCYLNEPVLTILRLLDMGLSRVAYVDIDAHHGDGVEAAFHGSEQVRVISVHEARRWPGTGLLHDRAGGAAFNLPVQRGFNDSAFSYVLNALILPLVTQFKPDAVYLQCGADALREDPLSGLALSNNAHVEAVSALREHAPRLIVSGGGGYNPWSVARCWTRVWAAVAGREEPDRLPQDARDVLHRLNWARKGRPDPSLLTTLADAPRHGAIDPDLRTATSSLMGRINNDP